MATVTKTYSLKVETQDKEVDELNKKLQKTEDDIGSIEAAGDKMTGGLVSGFKGAVKGVKSMVMGLKTMKGAIIATGIGALVVLVGSLTAAFTSSEEGQNKLAKAMGMLGAVVAVFTDKLAALGRGLINLFTEPVETIKNLGKSIKEFVMDKVNQAIESFGLLGSALKKLFSGDFKGALKDAGNGIVGLNKALNPAVMLTDALVKGTKELVKEMNEEAKAAGRIADQRALADKVERQLIIDRAKANRDRADLLNKAVDKENFTLQERIKFLEEAGKKEDEITQKEIDAANLRLQAKIAENALGDSTKEDLDEEVNLRAKLINLEQAKLAKAKEVTSQIIGLKNEEAAAQKAIDDKAAADKLEREKAEEERQAAIDAKQKELEQIKKDEEAITYEQKVLLAQERALAELDALNATEEQKAATILYWNGKVLDAQKKDAKEREKIEKIEKDAKLNMAKATFTGIANLLGENSKAGKAAAAAASLINTFQGITAELATKTATPFEFGIKLANIATTAAIGFKSVKDILATNPDSASGGGAAASPVSSGGSAPPAPPAPPAFNIVGTSGTDQLADVISAQNQQPVQAFVVSNDVSTAQELDRNIIEGASIG